MMTFSDPVYGKDFFGRTAVIELIEKRLGAFQKGYRQNIALIGHRQLGKTSVLHHLLHQFQTWDLLPIYVEIRPQAFDYFVDQFIRSLLYQYLKSKQQVEPSEHRLKLMEIAKPFIPNTLAAIRQIELKVQRKELDEAYYELFGLTSKIGEETGKRCVVMLDEFHRLGELSIKNPFASFGKRIMLQKDTTYLVSSSSFATTKKILAEKLSLLFGNFERIYLEPFDFDTSLLFIDTKLAPLSVPHELKRFLISFTDGHPFFLDHLIRKIRETALSERRESVDSLLLVDVLRKLFFESQGMFHQFFSNLMVPWVERSISKGSYTSILVEIACGRHRFQDISNAILRSPRKTAKELRELMEEELVVKNGIFYRLHNKLFKFWLEYVYQKRELSLMVDLPSKASHFSAEMEKLIQNFIEEDSRAVPERVVELFKCFQNDAIEWDLRTRRLPRFSEIVNITERDSSSFGNRDIIARGGGRCWICQIREKRVTEKEVLDFARSEEGSSGELPNLTRILIALEGIESTAKVVAKEKKVWTWGLSRLNTLMDLYGKPQIVHLKTHEGASRNG